MCHECNWKILEPHESYTRDLEIAKQVYKDIMEVINKWENNKQNEICCCWDEFIKVNDKYFGYSELKET